MRLMKVPSGEITNAPLLERVGKTRKPALLSTGMSTLEEVAAAIKILRKAGAPAVAVFQCVSNYPADPADANLRAMKTMARRLKVEVGYSDHTPGIAVAIAAAGLGAAVIEKHFTLDKTLPGPDHRMSLSPKELAEMVAGIRQAAAARGDGIKAPRPSERDTRLIARRSVVLARALPKGARLKRGDLACKRPGTGIAPTELSRVVGRRLTRAAAAETLLSWGMLAR
jgi:N-acetylneuraminate synthase/N,N'-diacetyllegionaminate synthase